MGDTARDWVLRADRIKTYATRSQSTGIALCSGGRKKGASRNLGGNPTNTGYDGGNANTLRGKLGKNKDSGKMVTPGRTRGKKESSGREGEWH